MTMQDDPGASIERRLARRAPEPAGLRFAALPLAALLLAASLGPAAAEAKRETLLFIRHAEKSPDGYGQLSCKGLNRALRLGARLAERYGRIDAVFAPDPSRQKPDGALSYDYVRPLATVEPSAIRFGLPVHAAIGYNETDKLVAALMVPDFHAATVLVAWEHHEMNAMVPTLVAMLGGDRRQVPEWQSRDFDGVWRVTIIRDGAAKPTVAFAAERQGLDGQPDACPD